MNYKNLLNTKIILILALIAVLFAAGISGCSSAVGTGENQDSTILSVNLGEHERESSEVGEHGAGGEGSGEAGEAAGHPEGGEGGSAEQNEAAMSSPIIPLDQSWNGVLGELEVSMQYDAATKSVYGTVKNTSTQKLCYVQAEPHLKSGTQTVGELGPDKLGDLNPGQQVNSSLSVASEPNIAGVAFDGYVIHMEVFDCNGPGPVPHTGGEGAESSSESGSEGGSGSGEESDTALAMNETYDMTRYGARLVMVYDAQNNAFIGVVANTTNSTLANVRVEVHLSNGTELGPTNPVDLPPGQMMKVVLPATSEAFDGWSAHPEVGGGEAGSEHGSSGETGGEHGGSGESGGEHGTGGEGGGR